MLVSNTLRWLGGICTVSPIILSGDMKNSLVNLCHDSYIAHDMQLFLRASFELSCKDHVHVRSSTLHASSVDFPVPF